MQKRIGEYNAMVTNWRTHLLDISVRLKSKKFGGGGIQIFPPPNAESERQLLQGVIDSMLSTLGPKSATIVGASPAKVLRVNAVRCCRPKPLTLVGG